MKTTKCTIISHHIYLTRDQRYRLNDPDQAIFVMGTSCPMSINENNEWESPVHEIFCNYVIYNQNKNDNQIVLPNGDGYKICLNDRIMRTNLKDVKDGGAKSLIFTHRNYMIIGGEREAVIHLVHIEDLEILLNSLS